MSDRNPNFHNRRSIRLKGYDYSQSGLYFITLCVQNRERLFGEIVGANVGAILRDRPENNDSTNKDDHAGSPRQQRRRMILNDAGKMVEKWYAELENKYPNIRCHEMMVMPNHFHCIIGITDSVVPEWDRPDMVVPERDAQVGAPLRGRPDDYGPNNKKYNPTIGRIVGWFKTMTTNEYIRGVKTAGWKRFNGKLWQRDYWEHIIRDEDEYFRIANYIIHNPEKWDEDQLYNRE